MPSCSVSGENGCWYGGSYCGVPHNWELFRLTDDPSRTASMSRWTRPIRTSFTRIWTCSGPLATRDPVDIFEQNKGRVLQYHVKDMNQAGGFTDSGQGLLDFGGSSSTEMNCLEFEMRGQEGPETPKGAINARDLGRRLTLLRESRSGE